MRHRTPKLAAIGFIALLGAPSALAALGGAEATVEADRLQTGATHRVVTTDARFTLHELQAPSGTTVREYVSPTGVVFGVAWQGPTMPDLRQLLGGYFDQYVGAMTERRTRRAPVSIQLPGLVLQSGGHMRAFAGKAYVPAALPQGVSGDDVR
jgi:hypothetical protein